MPNKIKYIIMGHVTKGGQDKPPVRFEKSEGGVSWAAFTVVAFRSQKVRNGQGYEDVPFFYRCKVFGKRAEWCNKWLKEKTAVLVMGEPEKNTYVDQDTGQKITNETLICSDVDFAGSKQEGGGGGNYDSGGGQSPDDDFAVGELGPVLDLDADPMESPGD